MALPLSVIERISRSLMESEFHGVHVDGVIPGAGDPSRVELLLTVGREEPHQVVVNLTRLDSSAFEHDLKARLTALVAAS